MSDAPSGTKEQDHLGFTFYAQALAFLIDWEKSKPPLTVAISAPSGSGKSSLAQQMQEQLKTHGDWDDDHIICQFNAWKHDDAPNLGAAFAAKVAQSANEERHWWRRLIQPLPSAMLPPEQRRRRQLYVILASLAVALGLVLGPDTRDIITAAEQPSDTHWINAEHAAHGFGLTLIIILAALAFIYPRIFSGTQAVARFINDPKSEAARGTIDSVSKQLGALIASATRGKRRFIVFVEDLDRCRPPRAVDVCEVVAQILDQEDVVTVLVGDMDTIARAAAIKYRSLELPTPVNADPAAYDEYGRFYMEKLVQLRFDLPQPSKEQLKELRNQLSSENNRRSSESSERPLEVTEESVYREYFKEVFDHPELEKVREEMYELLNQFLPKEPRAIKKFAYRMRLAIAIGIARGEFKIEKDKAEKGKVPKPFVNRFGKWLVLLDNWPIISQIGLDIELDAERGIQVPKEDAEHEHGMHFFEKAAHGSTSKPLQKLLIDCGLSDIDDVDRLRKFLNTGPPFEDVSKLASGIATPREDEVTRRAIKKFRAAVASHRSTTYSEIIRRVSGNL